MNFHQLDIFATVVAKRSFTLASEELSMTQPAVSIQVRALEDYLGLKLLERLPRDILLTEAGELVYAYAAEVLAATDGLSSRIAEIKGLHRGRLAIGASTTIGSYVLPALMGRFKQMYPQTTLTLFVENTDQVCSAVLSNKLDVGFIEAPQDSTELTVEFFQQDELGLIVSGGGALAKRKSLEPEELQLLPFISREPGSGTRRVTERRLREAGVKVTELMQLGHTEAIKQAVAADLGVSILSRCAVAKEVAAGTLVMLPIDGISLPRQFNLVYRRGRSMSPLMAQFRQFVKTLKPE
ncbi:MAG: LysR family transcriptional regulator [Chloroflexota bacterium]